MSRGFDKEEEKWRIMNTRHGVTFPVSRTHVAVYFRGLSSLRDYEKPRQAVLGDAPFEGFRRENRPEARVQGAAVTKF